MRSLSPRSPGKAGSGDPALIIALRRVERLAKGHHVGQPIDGDVPTENRYVFGLGVVINLSPSFLKIGASGAAALLK